ncbi:MAG: HAD-IA family hydrolase [Firmicutes bacterium]|nr:HAD-IA family hydrolase [Bacillota bacterium]
MHKKKAVLFDMDGTILDSLQDLMDSVNFALKGTGFGPYGLEQYRYFVGNGARNLIRRAIAGCVDPVAEGCEPDPALVDEVMARFKGHYETNKTNKTAPYEGIMELLVKLKEQGYLTAVISNKYDAAVKELAVKYFDGLLSAAVGEGGDVRPKPEPDGINKVLKQFGLTREEAIYVGDSDVDVVTAHNAGLFCVGVTWGFRGRQELEQAGAEAVIDTPEELWNFI